MSPTISFVKDEYNYHAAALIFGKRSPKLRDFSAFSLDFFRKSKDLIFTEHSGLNTEGHLEIIRSLQLGSGRSIQSSHSNMKSEINGIVTYIDEPFKIHLSDAVFSDEEFEYFEHNWDDTVMNKIRTLGMLIHALYKRKISDIPLLINEYINITKTLLDRAEFWHTK